MKSTGGVDLRGRLCTTSRSLAFYPFHVVYTGSLTYRSWPTNLQVTETWCGNETDVIGGLLGAMMTVARLVAHQTRSIKIEKTQSQNEKFCHL